MADMQNPTVELLRYSLKEAHELLENTMKDVTEEVAHWQPDGIAIAIGPLYVHAIVSEDILMNGWARKTATLLDTEWKEKYGVSEPHPEMDENWEANNRAWAKTVKIDLSKLREYAQAVYTQTDEYLAGLSDKDLAEKKVDLSAWGMGDVELAKYMMRFIIGHSDNISGEISALKGVKGLKGYPF